MTSKRTGEGDDHRPRGIAMLMMDLCAAGHLLSIITFDGAVHTGTFKRELESPDWLVMDEHTWLRLSDVRRWRVEPPANTG